MSNETKSPEFLACYPKYYGAEWRKQMPDYSLCANGVFGGIQSGANQCTRKNGHGPHGAYCKQHNPDAVKARRDAQSDKWRAERDAQIRKHIFDGDCIAAVYKIAAGHNEPRALAQSIIDKLEGAK